MNLQNKIIAILFTVFFIIYAILLILLDLYHPVSETLTCKSDYTCNIEKQSKWSKETSTLTMCYGAKLKLSCSTNDFDSCVLNFHGGGLGCTMSGGRIGNSSIYSRGIDVFSGRHGYFNNSENLNKKQFSEQLTNDFQNYMNGKNETFVVTKKYDQSEFYILSIIMTILLIGLLYTKKLI